MLECQKLISATLLRITEDKTIAFSINWDVFCQHVRTVLYAAVAIQMSDALAYKITKKWLAEDAQTDMPLRPNYAMEDVKAFTNKMLDADMKESHKKMCQG